MTPGQTLRRTAARALPSRRLAAALCGLAAALAGPALAQNNIVRGTDPTPLLHVGPNEDLVSRRIELQIGRSLIVDLPRDAKEIFVANPKVANAVVRSTRKLFLIGLENGATSVFVLDAEGRQVAALEVSIGRDLNVLIQTMRSALPHAKIDVKPAGDSILLTGVVSNTGEAQQAADIANAFVGVAGGLFGGTKGAVINALTLRGKDQVMLRVTIAEVSRTVLKQFGITTSASWSNLNFLPGGNSLPFPSTTDPVASGYPITASASGAGFNVKATLEAFERAGVSRILAEPSLTAISGESATFIAGGEVPIPSGYSCEAIGTGGGTTSTARCLPSITYKPFGVSLNFTPVVLSEGRISMRVGTEVSEIDTDQRLALLGSSIPGFKKRRTETTVELPSGGTIMSAGLLQTNMSNGVNGIPGLMNLPILGTLFRSRDYQRKETELMIFVTPFIAKPMDPAEVTRPDDGFVDAHDGQGILLGRLNRLYGTVGAQAPGPKYKGRFGFITD